MVHLDPVCGRLHLSGSSSLSRISFSVAQILQVCRARKYRTKHWPPGWTQDEKRNDGNPRLDLHSDMFCVDPVDLHVRFLQGQALQFGSSRLSPDFTWQQNRGPCSPKTRPGRGMELESTVHAELIIGAVWDSESWPKGCRIWKQQFKHDHLFNRCKCKANAGLRCR